MSIKRAPLRAGEGKIALAELLLAQTTAKQMALRNGGDRRIGTFLFDVREYLDDAVDDEQARFMPPGMAAGLIVSDPAW